MIKFIKKKRDLPVVPNLNTQMFIFLKPFFPVVILPTLLKLQLASLKQSNSDYFVLFIYRSIEKHKATQASSCTCKIDLYDVKISIISISSYYSDSSTFA